MVLKTVWLWCVFTGTGWWSRRMVTWWPGGSSRGWCWWRWPAMAGGFVWTVLTWKSCRCPFSSPTTPSWTAGGLIVLVQRNIDLHLVWEALLQQAVCLFIIFSFDGTSLCFKQTLVGICNDDDDCQESGLSTVLICKKISIKKWQRKIMYQYVDSYLTQKIASRKTLDINS